MDYANSYEERCDSYSAYEKYIRGKKFTLGYAVKYMQRAHLVNDTNEEDMAQKEVMRLTGTIVRRSSAAVLFKFSLPNEDSDDMEDVYHQRWFPLSQISYIMTAEELSGADDVIDVATWILKKDGLI